MCTLLKLVLILSFIVKTHPPDVPSLKHDVCGEGMDFHVLPPAFAWMITPLLMTVLWNIEIVHDHADMYAVLSFSQTVSSKL